MFFFSFFSYQGAIRAFSTVLPVVLVCYIMVRNNSCTHRAEYVQVTDPGRPLAQPGWKIGQWEEKFSP
jgi:hypothetical protein